MSTTEKFRIGMAFLLISLILSACGPSQEEMDVTNTQIAADIFFTLTAEAPTSTPTPTSTSTATVTQAWLQPRMITPRPPLVPLGERYITHFLKRGFEYYIDQDQYAKITDRVVLTIKVLEQGQMVGYVALNPGTEEENAMIMDHLREAGEFLDPGHGYATILSAIETLNWGMTDNGTAWLPGGREIHWFGQQNQDMQIAIFTFMNTPTFIGTEID